MSNHKVVLVSGGSSGIGRATAELLHRNGFIVYAGARRLERMKDLEQKGIHTIQLDVTVEESMVNCVKQIERETGGVDILVNNAGYGSYGAVEDVPGEEARRQFDVNVFGLARLTQLVLPKMRERGYGKIVNISSMGGKITTPFGGWYHATKFAVEALSDCLRFETGPFGIDVMVIEPGGIKTEWGDIALEKLVQTSGHSAYATMTEKTARLFKASYEDPKVSSPELIAEVIHKAITSEKPKTRYAAGFNARKFLFMRKLLSDRMYDRMLRSYLK
jgi:NAD(P)-dependent dehydrogenase (short-subunit alcohol dehydrogenase family)